MTADRVPTSREWNETVKQMSPTHAAQMLEANRSQRSLDVAGTVFRTAASHDERFTNPIPLLVYAWAEIYDCDETRCMDWLTPELARRAVESFYQVDPTGHLLPASVIVQAGLLRLEDSAQ